MYVIIMLCTSLILDVYPSIMFIGYIIPVRCVHVYTFQMCVVHSYIYVYIEMALIACV